MNHRLRARKLIGRREEGDPGTRGIRAMQDAAHADARPAFDRFDAIAKPREAEYARQQGVALLEPPTGGVLRGGGEAIVPDVAPGKGLPPWTTRA